MLMLDQILDRMAEEALDETSGIAGGCKCGGGCNRRRILTWNRFEEADLEGSDVPDCMRSTDPMCSGLRGFFGGWHNRVLVSDLLAAPPSGGSARLAPYQSGGSNIYRVIFPGGRTTIGRVQGPIRARMQDHFGGNRQGDSASIRRTQKQRHFSIKGIQVQAAKVRNNLSTRELDTVEKLLQLCCRVSDWKAISGNSAFDE